MPEKKTIEDWNAEKSQKKIKTQPQQEVENNIQQQILKMEEWRSCCIAKSALAVALQPMLKQLQ